MTRRVIEGTASGEAVAQQLLETYKNATKDWRSQHEMKQFCRIMVMRLQKDSSENTQGRYSHHSTTSKTFSTKFKALLISCGVWLGDEELCKSVLSTMKGSIPSEILVDLQEPLVANFAKFQQLLTDALCQMEIVTDVWQSLSRYLEMNGQDHQLAEWSTVVIKRVLESASLMAPADAHTLVAIFQRYDPTCYSTWYV